MKEAKPAYSLSSRLFSRSPMCTGASGSSPLEKNQKIKNKIEVKIEKKKELLRSAPVWRIDRGV